MLVVCSNLNTCGAIVGASIFCAKYKLSFTANISLGIERRESSKSIGVAFSLGMHEVAATSPVLTN